MLKIFTKVFIIILLLQSISMAREINLNDISKSAVKSNKTLFVFLHKTNCGYCENMMDFTLDDDKIKAFIEKKFLFVHINISEKDDVIYKNFKGNTQDFAKYIGYDFYPTSLFFDEENDLSYVVPGYKDEEKFFKILNYVDSKSYDRTSFRSYENEFDFKKKL